MAKQKASRKATTKKTASRKSANGAKQTAVNSKAVKVSSFKAVEVKINYLEMASKFSIARHSDNIHPRKVIPPVKVGKKIMDVTPSTPLSFEEEVPLAVAKEAKTLAKAPTDTLTLVKNVQLNDVATKDTASHVCEPSAAVNGMVVFYTGNWFAAVSVDGGTTFKYVNPYTTFPNPAGMQFCCDQVVHYIKSIDTFVWLLQYGADATGKNIQRIAFAKTAQVKTGTWKYYDITPAGLGLATGIWLDYPDLADGLNALYLTTNCFAGGTWKSSVIVRINYSSFTTNTFTAHRLTFTSHFSLKVAQNCGAICYFAAHNNTSSERVFSWKESSTTATYKDISVASWVGSGYTSTTPDGRDWLQRADRRHTGATLAGNELWLAWGSAAGGANARPHAFVQIARINVTTMTLIENINLWNPGLAIFYAALATNSNNEIGVSYAYGGGTKYPCHVVGIVTGTRRYVITFNGTRGPNDNKWGDYLTVRRNYPNTKLFMATGYSLQSGAGASDATPNLTIFGRSTETV